MLYISTLAFSKLSVMLLFRRITPVKAHLTVIWGAIGLTATWGLASFITTIFTCKFPHVWALFGKECFKQVDYEGDDLSDNGLTDVKQRKFWNAFSAYNIFTEAMMIAISIWILSAVRLSGKRKLIAMGVFFGRCA